MISHAENAAVLEYLIGSGPLKREDRPLTLNDAFGLAFTACFWAVLFYLAFTSVTVRGFIRFIEGLFVFVFELIKLFFFNLAPCSPSVATLSL
jgi:hypothetical protein